MSDTMTGPSDLPQRLVRWLLFIVVLVPFALGIAGRTDLPMLNAFVVACAALMFTGFLVMDPELSRERLRRGQTGEDPIRLLGIRLTFLALFVYALLDIGRLHWSDGVPRALSIGALTAFVLAFAWVLRAIAVNRFFVPVIRLQTDRGHRLVDTGPYAIVRHPGYAGMTLIGPACALALGSWGALVPGAVLSALFIARAAHEDRFLAGHLDGYVDYAARVRFRLVPGVW